MLNTFAPALETKYTASAVPCFPSKSIGMPLKTTFSEDESSKEICDFCASHNRLPSPSGSVLSHSYPTMSPIPSPSAPPSPHQPPTLHVPPLLALLDLLLGGVRTVNANDTETITDSLFGITLLVSTYDGSGNFVSATWLGFNIPNWVWFM